MSKCGCKNKKESKDLNSCCNKKEKTATNNQWGK